MLDDNWSTGSPEPGLEDLVPRDITGLGAEAMIQEHVTALQTPKLTTPEITTFVTELCTIYIITATETSNR